MDLEHEQRLTDVEARARSNTRRIEDIEKKQSTLERLTTSVALLAEREERVESDVKDIKNSVDTLIEKPGKRWDSTVDKVVWMILAALIGAALMKIGITV